MRRWGHLNASLECGGRTKCRRRFGSPNRLICAAQTFTPLVPTVHQTLEIGHFAGLTLAGTLAQTACVLAVMPAKVAGGAMLSHHKLKVYGKGLAVVASLGKHSVQ